MNERKWDINLELGMLKTEDGFSYRIKAAEEPGQLELICNGHPILAPEELYLVGEIAKEAYEAYIEYKKVLHQK